MEDIRLTHITDHCVPMSTSESYNPFTTKMLPQYRFPALFKEGTTNKVTPVKDKQFYIQMESLPIIETKRRKIVKRKTPTSTTQIAAEK